MSRYDHFRFYSERSTIEEKWPALRSESKRILNKAGACATLIHTEIEGKETVVLSDEFHEWWQIIRDSIREIDDLVHAMTDPPRRILREQTLTTYDLETLEKIWERGRPELRSFDNLLEAIEHQARLLSLPLAEMFADPAKVIVEARYPLVLINPSIDHRRIILSADEPSYQLRLLDDQTSPWYEVQPNSLEEATILTHRWLIENWTIEEISDQHSTSTAYPSQGG